MNLFGYDPKHKFTLPYYDKFPLSAFVWRTEIKTSFNIIQNEIF